MKKLRNPQQQIYEYIVSYAAENSYPPTVREICSAVGLASTSTVHTHLKNLEQKGFIRRDPTKQRSIVITGPQATVASQCIPLVGNVAAGTPILAVENVEDEFPLPPQLLHGAQKDEAFLLKVEGSSMVDAGMLNGDYIIVHNALQVNNGDIVVARIQGERATVKRFYQEKTRVRLQPENETMQPIYVALNDVEIVGKVIGLIRQY
ncbi:transcriptional repressor LexA [Christensenellaceae bacterium OttesenSCG-928-L17]|nr:transcriptional repressor LexA [Christensenellaceae bacterium OttesenSCG-928-L17]